MNKSFLIPVILSLGLAGCATNGYHTTGSGYYGSQGSGYYGSSRHQYSYGTVQSVRSVDLRRDTSGIGGGAVVGAVVGGLIGNQVGSGSGRTAATIAGAAAGGYVGDRIQDNNTNRHAYGQDIEIRMNDGSYLRVVQPGSSIYPGARVRVEGTGSNTRVYLDR